MSNQFCRYLSNGYSFMLKNNSLTVSPCCWYKSKTQVNSQLLQNQKLVFKSITGWTADCTNCKTLEDSGQQSLRQTGPDWISDTENSQDPITIDLSLDTECNAACVMCDQWSSSLWAKENLKLNNKKIKIDNITYKIDNAIDQIVNTISLSKLKYVKFFGGEPLFTDTHLKFIEHIPHPENVTLHYTTNASIYPTPETFEVWKKFQTVIFAASLDGIEEQFDYVRWPLKWKKVSENLIRLQQNKTINNIMFRVEFTANFLNTYYFDRLENWINQNLHMNLSGDKTELNIHHCWGGIWNLEKMPLGLRDLILKKYPNDHVMHKLVHNLSRTESTVEWKKFVMTWDSRRASSWKMAFPELVDLIVLE